VSSVAQAVSTVHTICDKLLSVAQRSAALTQQRQPEEDRHDRRDTRELMMVDAGAGALGPSQGSPILLLAGPVRPPLVRLVCLTPLPVIVPARRYGDASEGQARQPATRYPRVFFFFWQRETFPTRWRPPVQRFSYTWDCHACLAHCLLHQGEWKKKTGHCHRHRIRPDPIYPCRSPPFPSHHFFGTTALPCLMSNIHTTNPSAAFEIVDCRRRYLTITSWGDAERNTFGMRVRAPPSC